MFLLIIHFALTCFMTGLIWLVQLVHYPLMASVSPQRFVEFEKSHQRRISLIVAPAMLGEAVTAALLIYTRSATPLFVTNAVLVATLWLSTALVQMPHHRRLERGFDAGVHRRLVATNWLRTAIWSARSVMLAAAIVGQ